jgi:hypothetical protein
MNQNFLFIFIYLFVFGFNLNGCQLNAQVYHYFEKNLSENNSVGGFNLTQSFGTNSLISSFVLDFVNGKFITEEQKDRCIANFKSDNVIAGEQFNLALNNSYKLGASSNFLFMEAGETFFYETKLHQDIFKLIFKGNKDFENKSASLNPLQIRSLQYLYLKAGIHRMTEKYSFKFNMAYVGGQRFLDLNTSRGQLFTGTEGRFIDLNLKLNSWDVNPGSHSLFTISGNGFMTDLSFSYMLSKNTELGFGIEGLGLIKWNKTVTARSVDTLYHFEGEEISNVLDSFSIAIKNVDELKSSFIKETNDVNRTTNLPYEAYVQLSHFLIPDYLQIQLKYGYIKSEFSSPFLNSSLNLYLSTHHLVGLNVDAGAYGKLNIGGQLAFCFSNKSSIHFYFNSISNLILPSNEMNLTGGLIYRKAI